jgi:hypothetical protein
MPRDKQNTQRRIRTGPHRGRACGDATGHESRRGRGEYPSADRHELPLRVLCGSLHDPLRSAVIDPRCSSGSVDRCTVTACCQHRDHRLHGLCSHTGCNQLQRKVCIDCASVCAEPCTVSAGSACTDAEVCTRSACILGARASLRANGVTSAFPLCVRGCTNGRIVGFCVLANVVTVRARRAGLSPSATSIMVLTATAVSIIAGKIHAVAELYPMARIRSRSVRKLTGSA